MTEPGFPHPAGRAAGWPWPAGARRAPHAVGGRGSRFHLRPIDADAGAAEEPEGRLAADLEQLIAHVQRVVEQRHGVKLVPEVRVVGEEA